ncbi:MAG TPA: DUF4287 domain-containing protein [Gemmatales bacterium]|nr:DUF4287 domain-containing protein [Gemmatales bacterium]
MDSSSFIDEVVPIKTNSISSEAVKKATGKIWPQWFALLNKAGAATWSHKEIAAWLAREHSVPMWWTQMVTVEYERAQGTRVVHQKCDGTFSASVSRTLAVPLEILYQAWHDPKQRRRWLPEAKLHIRKANTNKSMRITWDDGPSYLSVNFYSKGANTSQIALDHEKLPGVTAVKKMKAYWGKALDRLKELMEK